MTDTLTIAVDFDLICPWCLIGKRHLAQALTMLAASEPGIDVAIRWQPVQLLPGLPDEGVPFADFYLRRLGSVRNVQLRQAQVRESEAQAGVTLNFSRIAVLSNTTKAHNLLNHVAVHGNPRLYDGLLEKLFIAFFVQGRDIGNSDVLLEIAQRCGLDVSQPGALLGGDAGSAGRPGKPTRGVPHFVLDGQLELSGVHSPRGLLEAMRRSIMARGSALQRPFNRRPTSKFNEVLSGLSTAS